MRLVPLPAAVLLVLAIATPAHAATVRVTSLSALQKALDAAAPGDRIELADGTYTASAAITVRRSGATGSPITVAARNTGRAEIRGTTGFAFAGGVHDVVLQGFSLRHGGSLSVPESAHHVRLTRNTVQLTVVRGTSGKLVDMVSGATVRYEGNIVRGGSAGIPNGYRNVDPKLVTDANGLRRLSSGSPAIDTAAGGYPYAATDFDFQTRTGAFDVGADEHAAGAGREPLTRADVGPQAP